MTQTKFGMKERVTYPMRAAFKTAFSTPPAAETCAPIFHGLVTRAGKTSVKFPLSSIIVRRRFLGLDPLSATDCSVQ